MRFSFLSFLKIRKEQATACALGGGPAATVNAEQIEDRWQQRPVLEGEIGEALEGHGFDDRAALVFKPGLENSGGAGAFRVGQCEARNDESEMPAELVFLGVGQQSEQGVFHELSCAIGRGCTSRVSRSNA
jgi:hypothetical protein